MANKDLAAQLIDKMFEYQETYEEVLSKREVNRRSLRDLMAQDLLTDEQAGQVLEVYPERAPRKSPEERAADLEAQAVAIREKAAQG